MTVFVTSSESEMQMGGSEESWSQGRTDGVSEEKIGRVYLRVWLREFHS